MTAFEKIMLARLDAQDLRIAQLEERSGLSAEAMDEFRLAEAIDHMHMKGDPSLIREYLRKKHAGGPTKNA